ncbi:uncharacterized protein At2g34460, chloroplastic-like isoform X2 [Miscanthus floridulus]|uniref:uncharacterized protein At2g34460, chloroplastic-like isoform X2 n=1 Tax=Miscanthus floridulus TaxID=154761 RepID=UPI0034597C12
MASAVCGVTARPHLPSAVPAAARKLFFRCRAASTMNEASASSPDAEEKKTTTVFVAGSTGRTGKRVVEKLLAKGFGVVAGTTDVSRARGSLPQDPNLQLVRADVTEGVDKLVEAVRGVDAVVCATGFRRSFDPFAPWKITYILSNWWSKVSSRQHRRARRRRHPLGTVQVDDQVRVLLSSLSRYIEGPCWGCLSFWATQAQYSYSPILGRSYAGWATCFLPPGPAYQVHGRPSEVRLLSPFHHL